jgi:hypothetical protein
MITDRNPLMPNTYADKHHCNLFFISVIKGG